MFELWKENTSANWETSLNSESGAVEKYIYLPFTVVIPQRDQWGHEQNHTVVSFKTVRSTYSFLSSLNHDLSGIF